MDSKNTNLVTFRYLASLLFIFSHGLLIFGHLTVGAGLHGLGEIFITPWALREKAWDLVSIAIFFLFFDLWGLINTSWH